MTKPVCHFDNASFVLVLDEVKNISWEYAVVAGCADHPRIGEHNFFIRTSEIVRKWANQHGYGFETLNTIYKSRPQKDA